MLTILSVVIGLVFVLLLFSLLTSTVMEIIAAFLSLRGKHLLKTLENMLGGKIGEFLKHPFFQQLSYATTGKSGITPYCLPGWVNKGTFSSILFDILGSEDETEMAQKIKNLPDSDLKRLLQYLLRESDGTIAGFKKKVEHWFDEVMERASDWYKRATKWWLFGVGLALAAAFNADTIQIYKSLSANSTLRQDFVNIATEYTEKHDRVAPLDLNKPLEQATTEAKELIQTYKNVVESPLGLGWTEQQGGGSIPWWLIKLAGLILTGIAVTFGAPFWFEILKKLISIRSSGSPAYQPPAGPPPYSTGGATPSPQTDEESTGPRDTKSARKSTKAVG